MNLTFNARIDGREILCDITSDTALVAPIFCFSLMAPMVVRAGGDLVRSDGGYGEILLPDLKANTPHHLKMRFANADHSPANRAWLPLGAYLRHSGGVSNLPPMPAGRQISPTGTQPSMDGLRLVPPPEQWQPSFGNIAATSFTSNHQSLQTVNELGQRVGLGPLLTENGVPVRVIMRANMPLEAYRLEILPDSILITAGSNSGVLYAGISLLTLITTHAGTTPRGDLTDSPRFPWRGQHLDCARHFYSVETILHLLDLMALLKLNRFHWHFADDEAFRLELNSLPELAQKTGFRGEGHLMPGVFGGGAQAGGTYSQKDARRIIAHAKTLNIEVMPEIEVTAHALAMLRVYPEMLDENDTGNEVSVQGYTKNSVNPAKPKTWQVLEAMIKEVASLFPFEVLHLGCDELPENAWTGSALVGQMKQGNGPDMTKNVQGWMMARLAEYAATFGKRTGAWEEAAQGENGGVGNDALLFSWSGQGPGIEAARAGYDVIMTPAQNTYFDMAHTADLDDWGASWAGFLPLAKTLDWSPTPENAPEISGRIKGVQGAFWSEFTTKDSQLWPMLLPRMLGLSCKAWDIQERANTDWLETISHAYAPVLAGFLPKLDPN